MSNLILFYDTETQGLPDWHEPSDSPQQPHIVQLAAMLVDPESRIAVQGMDVIVRPDGWEIPQEVVDIHGIDTEYARDVGISEEAALSMFLHLWDVSAFRVGHNESFDARIVRIAIMRYYSREYADWWKQGQSECTGKLAKPIMGIEGRRIPKLSEAYEFFTGEKNLDAHSAMGDAISCADVYWAIKGATDGA